MNPKQCVIKHEEWAEEYDSGNKILYFKLLTEVLDETIFNYLPKKGNILDAAGGTGRLSIPLAKKGYKVTCTDLSEKMLEQCQKKIKNKSFAKNLSILKSNVTDMKEFKRNQFDFSMCIGNPISYCDHNKALYELRRVTKKGGYLIVDMHSFYQSMRNCIRKKDSKSMNKLIKTHNYFNGDFEEHCFDIPEINRVFKENKIKIIKIIGKSVLPNSCSVKEMNILLKDKVFYNYLKQKELEMNYNPNLLSSALELCVIGKVL